MDSTVSVLKRERFQKLRSPFPTREFLEGKSQKNVRAFSTYEGGHSMLHQSSQFAGYVQVLCNCSLLIFEFFV